MKKEKLSSCLLSIEVFNVVSKCNTMKKEKLVAGGAYSLGR
uniref:Uncharacterized protein n=1 Tax=Oryza sativa subsp. japonica TaxID=39947 RepID=Q33B21_ORYSJ|nr:hypothetical protein LOC_Os10g05849 [Oryza sativa Japonica Group]